MKKLRELRKKHKLSMKEFGTILGLSESTISLYETGKREPDISTLVRISEYFNISVDELLGRTHTHNINNESINEHEKLLLNAYRKNLDMQPAVDRLLGIEPKMLRAIKIARSNNSTVQEIYGNFSDLLNAPRVESDDDI